MKADIFFFITSISVVLVSTFIIITLIYVIKVFRRILSLSDKLNVGVENVGDQVKEITSHIKESFLFNLIFVKKKTKKNGN